MNARSATLWHLRKNLLSFDVIVAPMCNLSTSLASLGVDHNVYVEDGDGPIRKVAQRSHISK